MLRRNVGSIRNRLLVSFLVIVLLAAGAISVITVILGSRTAKQQVIAQLQSVATLKQAEIDTWVTGLRVNLDLVVSGDQVAADMASLTQHPSGSPGRLVAYQSLRDRFGWAAERMSVFDELLLMSPSGTVVLSTRAGHEGEKHSIYDYFTEGLNGTFVQEPSYSLSSKQMIVVVSLPVKNQGQVVGVLAGRASLASLNSIMLERAGLGSTGETYLVGSNYRLLTSPRDGSREPEVYVRTRGADAAIREHASGSQIYQGYRSGSVIGVYRWLPDLKVALLAEQGAGEALSGTRTALMIVGAVAAIAVALALLAALFLTRSIVRPLAELAESATRISAGDLDRRAVVERHDEVGIVADAFNQMTDRLSKLVRSLEQRTDQLRAVNEVGCQVSSLLRPEELVPFVASTLRETFGYHEVAIIPVDRAAESGDTAAQAARTGETLVVNDDTRSELAVPLKVRDRVVGVLAINADRLDAFDDIDVFTAQTLADQLAIALENARLYEQAQELATIEERQRLARDLHDAVSQTLFSTSLIAEVLPRIWERDPDEGRMRMEELRRLTKGALAEMRVLLMELRPAALEGVSLRELVRQLADAFSGKSGVPVTLKVDGDDVLAPDVQVAVYRIVQETLNNIQKHAGATEVVLALLLRPDIVELAISDNGIGFDAADVSSEHLGLGIMEERARAAGASLRIASEPGRGTTTSLVWPDPALGVG